MEDFIKQLQAAEDCRWEDGVLRIIPGNGNFAETYSRSKLASIDPRLCSLLDERERLALKGFYLNLMKLLKINVAFWSPDVLTYEEPDESGGYRIYYKHISAVFPKAFTPGDYVRTMFEQFDSYVTADGVLYAYAFVSRERDVPVYWFDNYLPGNSNRLRAGIELGLSPEELAKWALGEANSNVDVRMPDDW